MAKDTTEVEITTDKIPANELISKFLQDNGIELYTDELSRSVKMISDGSIIVEKPAIRARYIK